MQHDWVASILGHGETMCRRCFVTNREAAALGMVECDAPPPRPAKEAAWQPIETAPKDGRRVDLWFPSSGRAADWQWETGGGIVGRSGGMWLKRYPGGAARLQHARPNDHPTYWMIVSPPAADKADTREAPHQPVNDPTLHELHDVWKSDKR